jgi:hypothetical protein
MRLVDSLAVAGMLLGGLLFLWAAADSNELTLPALGTTGFIFVATLDDIFHRNTRLGRTCSGLEALCPGAMLI